MIEISDGNTKAVFTGDLGNSPSLLLNDTEDIYRRRAAVSNRGGLSERSEGSAGD